MAATLREEMSREEPDQIESESGYTAESDPHTDPREQSPELAIVFKECGFWLQRGGFTTSVSKFLTTRASVRRERSCSRCLSEVVELNSLAS